MEIKANHQQEKKSPRDFRPWELLDFLPVGCFLYHQAARQIADSLDWDDYKLEALLADMAEAINAKSLPTVSRQTGLRVPKNSEPEFLGVVTVDDVNAWLTSRGATYRWTLQANTSKPQENDIDEPIDFKMLATRQQLIDAFGSFTGMDSSWFTNLKDTPKLKDARKVAGSGGKDSTEPLFCPYEVMRWLCDPKRKKGRKLSTEKGWQLLEGKFPVVFNQYSIGDTRTD